MKTIELTMNDVRNLNHNLDYREKNDFIKNFGWDEDQILKIFFDDGLEIHDWKGNKIMMVEFNTGFALLINNEIKHLISLYEPHGVQLLPEKDLCIAYGHDKIVLLWLNNNEFNSIRTR